MELIEYAIHDSFTDALVRGLKSSFLKLHDYRRLTRSENLEDLRSALEDTGYGTFMQDETAPISVVRFQRKLKEFMANQFLILKSSASDLCIEFLSFLEKESMIDNIVMILQSASSSKSKDKMISQLDPIGWSSDLSAFSSFEGSMEELFRLILVEVPVGVYFERYADDLTAQTGSDLTEALETVDFDIMRGTLKKLWLEDFYSFINRLDDSQRCSHTRQSMAHLLKKEADYLVLAVTLNSLNAPISRDVTGRDTIYPNFGYLYPDVTGQMRKFTNDDNISAALERYPDYLEVFEMSKDYYRQAESNSPDQLSFEDAFYRRIIKDYEDEFKTANSYSVYYAWFRLKEQEIRNILWIAEMILMGRSDNYFDMIVPMFESE